MTGIQFQERLDALVLDLQTAGKGQTVQLTFRGANNAPQILPLSSTAAGVVNAGELAAIQTFINTLKPLADAYEAERTPYITGLESIKDARDANLPLINTAKTAQEAVKTALEADATYTAAKASVEAIKSDPDYVTAVSNYRQNNVSENFQELSSAQGKYVV